MAEKSRDSRSLIIYESDDGSIKLNVHLDGETVWLAQEQIAELFATTKQNISKHIKNIYEEGELKPEQTVNEKFTVVENGRRYKIQYYNLDVIISVGYRVNSTIATRFRQWATQSLKEYMVKGFVMDDKRLAEGNTFAGNDYFDELTERVRRIRTSERRFYQKVQAVFSETSYDYDSKSPDAQDFYATIQNKFHYAVTGKTAAELITSRISSQKPNVGLTVFDGPKPTVAEAKVAKNYMIEDELRRLYLISEQFLSFAELQMSNKSTMLMKDWRQKLDEMLALNDLKILRGKGQVSHAEVEHKVKQKMAKYSQGLPKPKED